MTDYDLIRTLLHEADLTGAPSEIAGDCLRNATFTTKNGWSVVVVYSRGYLDRVDHFVSPTGEKFDVWAGDERLKTSEDFIFSVLQCWRDVGDGARLAALLPIT